MTNIRYLEDFQIDKLLRDLWSCFNSNYFRGDLPETHIIIADLGYRIGQIDPELLGQFFFTGMGEPEITISRSLFQKVEQLDPAEQLQQIATVMLHEMIHEYLWHVKIEDHKHRAQFIAAARSHGLHYEKGNEHLTSTAARIIENNFKYF